MDLYDIPFGVPVIIQSIRKKKNLQNPVGTKKARCLSDNRDAYEQMVLHRQANDKVAIQSVRNGRFLQIRTNGDSTFESQEINERTLFTLETNRSCSIFFVSSYMGNVLHCNDKNIARCGNQLRELWEEWKIVEPRAPAAGTGSAVRDEPVQHHVLAGLERQ